MKDLAREIMIFDDCVQAQTWSEGMTHEEVWEKCENLDWMISYFASRNILPKKVILSCIDIIEELTRHVPNFDWSRELDFAYKIKIFAAGYLSKSQLIVIFEQYNKNLENDEEWYVPKQCIRIMLKICAKSALRGSCMVEDADLFAHKCIFLQDMYKINIDFCDYFRMNMTFAEIEPHLPDFAEEDQMLHYDPALCRECGEVATVDKIIPPHCYWYCKDCAYDLDVDGIFGGFYGHW